MAEARLLSYRGTWFYLFISLILLIVLYPFFEIPAQRQIPWVLALFHSIIILSIVYATSARRGQFWLILSLWVLTVFINLIPDTEFNLFILFLLRFLIYLYAIYLIISYFVHTHTVGFEEVYGAVSLYLLLGLIWAIVYENIEHFMPGSFYVADVQNLDLVLIWSDFIYFSFVTLTTLGYGDITPVTAVARSVAILEAIAGLFCLGILVAGTIGRLVSMSVMMEIEELKKERD